MGTDAIEVPIFYGEDPVMWVSWMSDFADDQGFSDLETRWFAYGFIEGDALTWYYDEMSRSVFRSWGDLQYRLLMRFSKSREDTITAAVSFQDQMRELHSFLDQWVEEDKVKKQPEEETGASEDSNQIVSNIGGSLRKFDQIVDQFQRSSEEKKVERDEIQTIRGIVSEVRGSPEKVDPILYHGRLVSATEATKVAEKELSGEHNQYRKKKKRWKEHLPENQKCVTVNLSSKEQNDTSLGSEEDWYGNFNRERWNTYHCERGKIREAKENRFAYQVFDKMYLKERRVTKKRTFTRSKGWKYKAKKVESGTLGIQMENMTKGQRKSLKKWWKRVGYQLLYYQPLLNKRWLLRFRKKVHVLNKMYGLGFTRKKKKKSRLQRHERKDIKFKSIKNDKTSESIRKTRMEYEMKRIKQELMFVELLRGRKTVVKKLAKRIKHKFKQKHNMRWARIKLGVLEMMLASQMEKSKRTKWKKRKTKHQYQYKHKSKVKGRSLTNQFLTRMDSGVGVIIGQRAVSSPAVGWKVKEMEGYPLVDADALKSLIRLLPFAQPLGKDLLQSLLIILGVHSVTKSSLVQLLSEKIRPAMEASPSELEISHPQRLYGCQSNVVKGLSQLLNGLPPLIFCRVLEVWTYLAANHLTVADMLFYFEWSVLSQLPKPKPCGGKGEERVTHETDFWNLEISLVVFLKLLNLPLLSQSTSCLALFMGLLQVVVYTAAVRMEGWYHSSGVPERSEKEPVGEKASSEIGEDAESELVHEADELSVARSKNYADIYNIFLQLPQPDLYNLCIIICASLPTLNHTQKMNHTTGSTAGVSLLCVLQVLCSLTPAIDDSNAGTEKETEQEEALTKGEGLSKCKYSWKWKSVIYNLEDKVEFKGASIDT